MSDEGPDYPTSGEPCTWKDPLGIFVCPYPAWAGNPERQWCLYHSPENGKTEETAREVWAEARAEAGREPPQGGYPNFSGWHFPKDPSNEGFRGATFHQGLVWFWDATFHGEADFGNATFEGDARFWGATFQGEAKFSGAKTEPGVDIEFDTPSPFSWLWGNRFFRRTEEGETAYRLAKQAAQARGDYRRAGEYHYAEQCAIEYGNRKLWGWRPWSRGFWRSFVEWPFARLLFGYGEKPLRPLFAGLVVILLWSFFYCYFSGIGPGDPMLLTHDPTWFECLHFSVVTFTTLGYGDFQPKPDCRPIADAEAVLGAALMATFIVGLTRKYMR